MTAAPLHVMFCSTWGGSISVEYLDSGLMGNQVDRINYFHNAVYTVSLIASVE